MKHPFPGVLKPFAMFAAAIAAPTIHAQTAAAERELTEVNIQHSRPSVVTGSPAAQAEVTGEQVREFNAVNVEDAVKYLPSLQIRKRYIGDRNAIVASRTAGTVQSARALVYADGLLLSNLLGNSFGFPPRWNLIGTEEIETVNVLYGPYSATLPGNSAGATILMTTRKPKRPKCTHVPRRSVRISSFTEPTRHLTGIRNRPVQVPASVTGRFPYMAITSIVMASR